MAALLHVTPGVPVDSTSTSPNSVTSQLASTPLRTEGPRDRLLAGPPRCNRRRARTMFSQDDLDVLEDHFRREPYPDIQAREAVALELGVPEARIHTWFQNKRTRTKRSQKAGTSGETATKPTCPKPEASHSPGTPSLPAPAVKSELPQIPTNLTTSATEPLQTPPGIKRPWEDTPTPPTAPTKRPRPEPLFSSPDSGVSDLGSVDSPLDLSYRGRYPDMSPAPSLRVPHYSSGDGCFYVLPGSPLAGLTPLALPTPASLLSPGDLVPSLFAPRHFIFPPPPAFFSGTTQQW